MANILYGVAGEGSGHSSRAKEVINHLLDKGHTVKIISYDRGYKNLSRYFEVEKIFGLKFVYKDNKVRSVETAFENLINAPEAVKSINRVSKIVDDFRPDLVFSDFEPISCLVANTKKVPLISIDNQHRITNTDIEYPRKYEIDAITAKTVINMMIYNTKAVIVTSFFSTEVKDDKTFVFSPILRKEVLEAPTLEKDYILVYVTSKFQNLIDILKKINKKFIVYGFDCDKKEGNIIFKKASQKGFLDDLRQAEGVVANAGFTLMTESLYFHKPMLTVPVAGQFEQVLNAYYLEKLGFGKYWDELNKERIESFLYNIDMYKKNLKKYSRNDNLKIFKKIDELIKLYS